MTEPAGFGTRGRMTEPAGVGTRGRMTEPAGFGTRGRMTEPAGVGTRGRMTEPAGFGTRGRMTEPRPLGSFSRGIALVTGGSQGLGYAVAQRLVSEGAAGLMLVGRDRAKGEAAAASLRTPECRAEFVAADLREGCACEAVIETLDSTFGTCHSFVNCAAVTDRGSVWDATPELWDVMLAVNVKAPALLSQGVARIMAREAVEGTIVLIGSIAGRGGPPKLLPYSTSKGALVAMTRNLAFA